MVNYSLTSPDSVYEVLDTVLNFVMGSSAKCKMKSVELKNVRRDKIGLFRDKQCYRG